MKINFTLKRTKNFNNICVAALNRQTDRADRQTDRQTRDNEEEVAQDEARGSCNSNGNGNGNCAVLRVAHSSIYGTLRLKTKLKFNK